MNIRYFYEIPDAYLKQLETLFESLDLRFDKNVDFTVVLEEGNRVIGTASRSENIFKLFALLPEYRGQNLASLLVTELKKEGLQSGWHDFALITKPKNYSLFAGIGFYPIIQTKDILFMEDRRHGIDKYLDGLYKPEKITGQIAAIVMNGDPFTLGHYELVSRAAEECQLVYLFILSENRGTYSSQARLGMAEKATQKLNNVYVYPTQYYMISSATFPDYFLKKTQNILRINCELDVKVFTEYFVKRLGITRRYVGEEPFCKVTKQYNEYLKKMLVPMGVDVIEISRKTSDGIPISASNVRDLVQKEQWSEVRRMVPEIVYEQYLKSGK